MRKWNQFVWLCVQVLNIFIKTHLTMDSIVVYGDGNVAFFQVLLLLAVPKKTMQSVFGNITNLRWPLLLVPLLCELPRSNTGLKKRIPKKLPNLPSQGRFIWAIGERAANADWRAHL